MSVQGFVYKCLSLDVIYNLRTGELLIIQQENTGKIEVVMESIPSTQTMLPMGFRFRPYDDELITGYLLKKVKGEELSWHVIGELDLYDEKATQEICGDISDMKEKVSFSTKLKKLLKNRVGRTTGCEVWNESCIDKIYDYKGDVIRARNMLCFNVKQGLFTPKSDQIMHEFSQVGKQEQTSQVMCTLQKKGLE